MDRRMPSEELLRVAWKPKRVTEDIDNPSSIAILSATHIPPRARLGRIMQGSPHGVKPRKSSAGNPKWGSQLPRDPLRQTQSTVYACNYAAMSDSPASDPPSEECTESIAESPAEASEVLNETLTRGWGESCKAPRIGKLASKTKKINRRDPKMRFPAA